MKLWARLKLKPPTASMKEQSAKSSMSFGPAASDVSFSGLPLKLVEQRRSKSRNKASLMQTPDKASAKPERVKSTVSLRKVNLSRCSSSVKKGIVLTARLPEHLTSIVSS